MVDFLVKRIQKINTWRNNTVKAFVWVPFNYFYNYNSIGLFVRASWPSWPALLCECFFARGKLKGFVLSNQARCLWSSARLPAYLSSTRLKSSRGQRNARPAYVTFPTSISMKGDLVKSGFNSVFCGSLDSKVFLFNKITLSRCLLR